MVNRFVAILIIIISLNSCKKDQLNGNTQTNAALADSLRLSPFAAQIDNDSLFLSTYVWRNFMPGIGKDGSGLYCSNQLTYKDSLPIPSGLKLKTQYVINENQIWTNQHPEINYEQSSIIEGSVSGGPKWGPDIFVDVVCEFEIDNHTYRIIAKHQKINATY